MTPGHSARKREYLLNHSKERYYERKLKFKSIKGKIKHHILWILQIALHILF